MSDVAALIADMVRQGVDPDIIGRTAEALSQMNNVDQQAERRRERDRARKQEERLRKSAESADVKKEKNQKKKSTPLGYTPKGDISSSPQGGTKKRACRIPDDWGPDRSYAAEKGLSSQQIDIEAEKFRNYWGSASGQRATKVDWAATWRSWVLNAIGRMPQGHSPPQKPRTGSNAMLDALKDLTNEPDSQDNNFDGHTIEATAGRATDAERNREYSGTDFHSFSNIGGR